MVSSRKASNTAKGGSQFNYSAYFSQMEDCSKVIGCTESRRVLECIIFRQARNLEESGPKEFSIQKQS